MVSGPLRAAGHRAGRNVRIGIGGGVRDTRPGIGLVVVGHAGGQRDHRLLAGRDRAERQVRVWPDWVVVMV